MTAYKLNKIVASALGALILTVVLSWTFVDATSAARMHRDANSGAFLAVVSALVR